MDISEREASQQSFVQQSSHPDQQVDVLYIALTTGDDDLRQGSEAVAYALVNHDHQIEEVHQSMNNKQGWASNSLDDAELTINTQIIKPVHIRDIQEFGIRFTSGQQFPWETGDNWDLKYIEVSYTVDGQTNKDTLLSMSGDPLKRFVSDHDEWHVTFF